MNPYNKYGFVSGGAIFDTMDRFALRTLNADYPETEKEYWFTTSAETSFIKQACPGVEIRCRCERTEMFENTAIVAVAAYADDTLIAASSFMFKKATHDFCKIKEGTNENNHRT